MYLYMLTHIHKQMAKQCGTLRLGVLVRFDALGCILENWCISMWTQGVLVRIDELGCIALSWCGSMRGVAS